MSVIITTHDRADLLPRAIASVEAQTYRDWELIVVDDASSDDTPAVLRDYADAGVLRSIRIDASRGANHARRRGFDASSGDLVAYLDDDDEWLDRKLELQVGKLDADPSIVLVGCAYSQDGHPVRNPPEVPHWALLSGNLVGGFSVGLFRRQAAVVAGGFDESLRNGQDWDFWIRLSQTGRVVVLQDVLATWETRHADRISARRNVADYYRNYARVVEKHAPSMGALARAKHLAAVRYHMTDRDRGSVRLARGIAYGSLRTIDRFVVGLRLRRLSTSRT